MSANYAPELGQMLFGQPSQQFESDSLMDASLGLLREELDRVLWNRIQQDSDNPFDNSGATFEAEGLKIHAYSWGDEDQPWNLKCGDIEVSWYKHSLRGTSVNRDLAPSETRGFLDEALAIIRDCDERRAFTYCGDEYPARTPHDTE